MTAANTLIERAASAIGDPGMRRWGAPEWLDYLNDARRALVALVPQAVTVNTVVVLLAGTRQALPADGLSLIDVVRNMGADGSTPGRYVRMIRRQDMDVVFPNWQAATPANDVTDVMWDPRDPTLFYTYPPAVAGRRVEINYFSSPADMAHNGDTGMQAIYDPYLVHYMMFRAYSKNTDTASEARAASYYALFGQIGAAR